MHENISFDMTPHIALADSLAMADYCRGLCAGAMENRLLAAGEIDALIRSTCICVYRELERRKIEIAAGPFAFHLQNLFRAALVPQALASGRFTSCLLRGKPNPTCGLLRLTAGRSRFVLALLNSEDQPLELLPIAWRQAETIRRVCAKIIGDQTATRATTTPV